MTQCNLTQTEQMRRKEIADHTRALVVNLLHVDAEDFHYVWVQRLLPADFLFRAAPADGVLSGKGNHQTQHSQARENC